MERVNKGEIKMKVIFLDIDGVLNLPGAELGYSKMGAKWRDLWTEKDPSRLNAYSIVFSPSAIYHLGEIVRQTGAKIVISSTWRRGSDLEEMKGWFLDPDISEAIIGKTPCFYSTSHPELADKQGRVQRGEEIYWYIQNSKEEITRYAVIDDDGDMDAVRRNFFQTDGWDGLTRTISKKIIKHLNYRQRVDHYRMNHVLDSFISEFRDCLSELDDKTKENYEAMIINDLQLLCTESNRLYQERMTKERKK